MTESGATEHHHLLHRLAGHWVGEETLHPTPFGPGGTAVGRFDNRVGLNGLALIVAYEQEREGGADFQGHGIYGWNAKRAAYTMYWSDSAGGTSEKVVWGRLQSAELLFEAAGDFGHLRYVYTFVNDASFRFRIDSSQDGRDWSTFMEGTYRRSQPG